MFSSNSFKPSYWHESAPESYLPITMGQLIDYAADRWGEDEAFVSVHDNSRFSFKEAKEKANQLASGLLELGLKQGDTIALWGNITGDSYIILLASALAGLIFASVRVQGDISDLARHLSKVEAKAIVVIQLENDKNYCEMLCEAIPELSTCKPGKLQSKLFPKLETVITLCSNTFKGTFNYNDVLNMGNHSSIERVNKLINSIQPDDGFIILSTSGSTGKPKCLLQTHHKVINRTYINNIQYGLDQKGESIFATYVEYDEPLIFLVIVRTFLFGCTAVISSSNVSEEYMVNSLQNERCTSIVDVVNIIDNIVKYAKKRNISLSHLENIIMYGTATTKSVVNNMLNVLPTKQLYISYGSTECGEIGCTKVTCEVDDVLFYRVARNTEVKIVDEEGEMVPLGKTGELCVRSHSVMEKYLNDDEETAKSKIQGGWYKTGDYFILEENGYIKFVNRIKETIIKFGENIYPREIESVLSTHPSVNQVCAIGVPDNSFGEDLFVFIQSDCEALTEEDVKSYCKGRMTEFKIPRYVRFLNEFPKLANGKVNKIKLLEMFKCGEKCV